MSFFVGYASLEDGQVVILNDLVQLGRIWREGAGRMPEWAYRLAPKDGEGLGKANLLYL